MMDMIRNGFLLVVGGFLAYCLLWIVVMAMIVFGFRKCVLWAVVMAAIVFQLVGK